MRIALIHSYSDKPWRSPKSYASIEAALRSRWQATNIHARDEGDLLRQLYIAKEAADADRETLLVFNIAEYVEESSKIGFIPQILDDNGFAHVGSSAKTVRLGLDKAETKLVLRDAGLPTPPFFTTSQASDDVLAQAAKIGFPLIVKPVAEGGHIGIDDQSIARDEQSLLRAIEYVLHAAQPPIMIERYLTGEAMREFSVGILDGPQRLFTPIEIDYEAMNVTERILSFRAAQNDLERVRLIPDQEMQTIVCDLASRAFDAVGACDYGRVDLRMDDQACHILEINIMPGLGTTSFLPQAAERIHGISFDALIVRLAESAARRHFGFA